MHKNDRSHIFAVLDRLPVTVHTSNETSPLAVIVTKKDTCGEKVNEAKSRIQKYENMLEELASVGKEEERVVKKAKVADVIVLDD